MKIQSPKGDSAIENLQHAINLIEDTIKYSPRKKEHLKVVLSRIKTAKYILEREGFNE